MGNLCSSCFKGSVGDSVITPSLDQKRQQIAQAAEKRAKENESKGIKNPEKVKRMQELARQRELQEEEAARSSTEGGLKWQVG
ncbi:hypothetical protein M8J76_003088 [Diaphorina citri]|nr:hypothetical protein M8J75_002466 [Diaphorina citri]KAI5744529.1 hypothetical protein M8J76_003088 [Diaphorina citri]KAI5751222.1 hypothetical protein M8J77_005455 [Diaphorina citri]